MSPFLASVPPLLGLSYPTHDHAKTGYISDLSGQKSRSCWHYPAYFWRIKKYSIEPSASRVTAASVTPSLILMRKTDDAVRTDDLPNAEWNETNER